jgi:putative Holliday junction resolvase
MRFLAIDLGGKRTGLAVGDDELGQVGPAGMIESAHQREILAGVRKAIDDYAPDALVVGVPYQMDGSAGPAAKQAERLSDTLAETTGLTVHRFDERLTSYAADDAMRRSGYTHRQKKARRDALAAAAILRDFLANRES